MCNLQPDTRAGGHAPTVQASYQWLTITRNADVVPLEGFDKGLAYAIASGDWTSVTRKAAEQPVDTSSQPARTSSTAGIFAEFETNLRRERQIESKRGRVPHCKRLR